jgi:hypothetical protein
MKTTRFSIGPGTGIAVLALFFALGGSAFAVGERMQGPAATQQRCGQGNVRGVAHVTGGPSGMANIPGRFTGAKAVFGRRYNCGGRATQVRRVSTGIYEVRFVGNPAASAVASGGGGVLASVESRGGGTFTVSVVPWGIRDPADLPFVIVAV